MTFFNLTKIHTVPGGAATAVHGIEAFLSGDRAKSLVGCWVSEIGLLNEVVVLRKFQTLDALAAEPLGKTQIGLASDGGDFVRAVEQERLTAFPGIAPIEGGSLGKFYELRTYHLTAAPQAMPQTIAAWQAAIPDRVSLSPLAIVMQAISGSKRIVHIWPFHSLDHRQAVRAEAVRKGWWPPKGTLQWMESASTSIYVPAVFSPLQ